MRAFIAQVKKAKVPTVVLHIGGADSRGDLSDDSNRAAAMAADYSVVIRSGDADQFFSGLAAKRGVPIEVVDGIPEATAAVARLFKTRLHD